MAHRLALQLGEPDVDAMLAAMTPQQWDRWRVFYSLDPWSGEREDWRSCLIASVILNLFIPKGQKPVTPKSLMPKFGRRLQVTKEQQIEIEVAAVAGWAAALARGV